ncbi:MAG: DNA alkylation repair protein [Planctomycetales bacterium]|nr:DNA alkylation repair protein [Planctomycetales bacterium]
MDLTAVMSELKRLGSEQTRRTLSRHGLPDDAFGVKVGDLKQLIKKIKQDHELALELYDTGNADAQYLASFLLDDQRTTKRDLQRWVDKATWYMVSEYAVAWAAAESRYGWELGLKWIDSKKAHVVSCGWSTLSSIVSIKPDEELDLEAIAQLLERVATDIKTADNRVRYTMNGFVMSVGGYVAPLSKQALKIAKRIGKVEVDMGKTACKVPDATEMIEKISKMGRVGKKRKEARC